MSKMTKTIAILGVVAGLGVATMPLSSFATGTSKEKDLTITATVKDAISLEIQDEGGTATTDKVEFGEIEANGEIATQKVKAVVNTNADSYKLMIKAKTTDDVNLRRWDKTANSNAGDYYTGADAATIASSDLTATDAAGWGAKIGDSGVAYQAVTAEGVELKKNIANTDKTHDITFGIRALSTTRPGDYRAQVVITAVTE